MKLVFMGTGHFAVPSLGALARSNHEIALVFTQPDKPAGRGHSLRMPPTKLLALEHSIPVQQPEKVRSSENVELLRRTAPDCIVVVAYGQIIPPSILDIPPFGIVNLHASLLPAYRGAAPIQWAIVRGETETGVTTMLMDAGLDTGPTLLQRRVPIHSGDTGETLEKKLASLGADLLLETLEAWEARRIEPQNQDDTYASKAPRIRKEDAHIDWNLTAEEIDCRVRGFLPWPVAFTTLQGTTVKIWKASLVASTESAGPGETLSIDEHGIVVGCGASTSLRLIELQAEGRRRMSGAELARGKRLTPGTRWGA